MTNHFQQAEQLLKLTPTDSSHPTLLTQADLSNPESQNAIASMKGDKALSPYLGKLTLIESQSKVSDARQQGNATELAKPQAPGKTIVNNDFRDLGTLRTSGNDTVSTRATADQHYLANFVLDRSRDNVPYRTELESYRKDERLEFGKEYSIEFRNRLVDWKPDKSAEIMFQLHPIPSDGNWNHPSNPDVTLRTKNGKYEFTSNRHVIWSAPYKEGEWNDWQVKMRVAGDKTNPSEGYLDLYRNGVKVASTDGPNVRSFSNDGYAQDPGVYAKVGIYKWDWKTGLPATDTSRREIDYDYFRMTELKNGRQQDNTAKPHTEEVKKPTETDRTHEKPARNEEKPEHNEEKPEHIEEKPEHAEEKPEHSEENHRLSDLLTSTILSDLMQNPQMRQVFMQFLQAYAQLLDRLQASNQDEVASQEEVPRQNEVANHETAPKPEIEQPNKPTPPGPESKPSEPHKPSDKPTYEPPQAPSDNFTTKDGKIFDPEGKPFTAKGFAMYAWDQKPEEIRKATEEFKPNIIRLATSPDKQTPEQVQKVIDEYTKKGIVVEVEDHFDSATKTGAELKKISDWYAQIAKANVDNPYVWFGTPNEQYVVNGNRQDWVNEQFTIYNAIRGTGNNNVIMLEQEFGGSGQGLRDKSQTLELEAYRNMENVVIDQHFYSGKPNAEALLDRVLDRTRAIGLPVIVGEFGNTNGPKDLDDAASVAAVIKANQTENTGAIAWAWENPGGPVGPNGDGNAMYNKQGQLTLYGGQIRSWINGV